MIPRRSKIGAKLDKAYNSLDKDFAKKKSLKAGIAMDLKDEIYRRYIEIAAEIEIYEEYLGRNYYK